MPEYRRPWVPHATYFLTLVAFGRQQLFAEPRVVEVIRNALAEVREQFPFSVEAAVVLPDHMHFIWSLEDDDLSSRVGRFKVRVTRSIGDHVASQVSNSRSAHRESNVWQRRFWEHLIRDDQDFQRHLDYIHYNPVKPGWARCPHSWHATSFPAWVRRDIYEPDWGCQCHEPLTQLPVDDLDAGE